MAKQNLFHWHPAGKKQGGGGVKRGKQSREENKIYNMLSKHSSANWWTISYSTLSFETISFLHCFLKTVLTGLGMGFHALICFMMYAAHSKFQQLNAPKRMLQTHAEFPLLSHNLRGHSMWPTLHSCGVCTVFLPPPSNSVSYSNLVPRAGLQSGGINGWTIYLKIQLSTVQSLFSRWPFRACYGNISAGDLGGRRDNMSQKIDITNLIGDVTCGSY